MHNTNSTDECVTNKSRPRIIKKFEKRPPLKVSNKTQPSEGTSSVIKDKINTPQPVPDVNNGLQNEKNIIKNETNTPISTLKNNLSCTQDKYETANGKSSNGSNANAMPANRRLSALMNRLKQLQITSNTTPQGVNSRKNLSSTNKSEINNKSSNLNNKLSSNVMNGTSKQVDGSQDKDQLWSLSRTIWSPDIHIQSKEISCALSLEGTLILTNIYSGSLCSTKEYSKPALLKPLNSSKDNDWNLSKKIWPADQILLENNTKLSPRTDYTVQSENGISSALKDENSLQALEKENNVFKASQDSVQQKDESQKTSECNSNTTTTPTKKSRMSILLERLRSAAHDEQLSSPTTEEDTSPPRKSTPTQSSSSSPCKSKPSPTRSTGRPRPSCYNCGLDDHKFYKCPQPLTHRFCHRCGWEDVTIEDCPFCTGTLVRPGSTRPVPVGGDARKRYSNERAEEHRGKREKARSREKRSG